MFGKKCELCHETRGGMGFKKTVSDQACLACHDAPAHHPTQVSSNPTCGSCHVEHRSALKLAHTQDAGCAQCHTNLQIKSGDLKYTRSVTGFDSHHPEFIALRPGAVDPGTIKLNHYAHLNKPIDGPHGKVQMRCQDCHRPTTAEGTWPYSSGEVKTVALTTDAPRLEVSSRAYMAPIRFTAQCAACHMQDLRFDFQHFGTEAVPHDKPAVVQEFLTKKYTEYFATHPNALSEPLHISKIISPIIGPMPPTPHTRDEWIKWQVANADQLLYGKGCKLCHTITRGESPGAVAEVAKSAVPVRWLQHSDFDHDAHRMVACSSCHSHVQQSKDTADILLPNINSCRGCHQEAGAVHDAADGRCSECHEYHDWKKEQGPKKDFTIPQLRSSAAGLP
jgi:hypothetical protein